MPPSEPDCRRCRRHRPETAAGQKSLSTHRPMDPKPKAYAGPCRSANESRSFQPSGKARISSGMASRLRSFWPSPGSLVRDSPPMLGRERIASSVKKNGRCARGPSCPLTDSTPNPRAPAKARVRSRADWRKGSLDAWLRTGALLTPSDRRAVGYQIARHAPQAFGLASARRARNRLGW